MPRFRCWYGIALNMALAVLAVSGAVFFTVVIRRPFLEIRDSASGKVYARQPLAHSGKAANGGEFAIEFVHSVHQSPVREMFTVQGREMRAAGVRFSAFGAGMQSDLDEGRILSRDGDALVISGGNKSFRELNYIVGTVSDHLLIINSETISLRDLCGKNAHITIRIR